MTTICVLSDTHGFLDPVMEPYLQSCDEIWHAGDIGSLDVLDQLRAFQKPVQAVYGNIDGQAIRLEVPAELIWYTGDLKIFMTHIGGYPGHYARGIRSRLRDEKPHIFVCGHSHILKVIYDKELELLHLNPGACGKEGFHKVRTMVRFTIDAGRAKDMAVIELGTR